MPQRVLRLLQYLGFSGKKKVALGYLLPVARGKSMWAPIAAMAVCGYHCYIEFFLGLGKADILIVEGILKDFLTRYPDSGFFLILEATLKLITGYPKEAIILYTRSSDKFTQWKEWQNTCHWMITWCYAIQCDWKNSLKHTKILFEECSWSKCVFAYHYAAFLKMIADETVDPIEKAPIVKEMDHYFRLAPTLKRSFAGKTIFIEKFVTKRCQIYREEEENNLHYLDENHNNSKEGADLLLIPVLELFLFYNLFFTIKHPHTENLMNAFLDRINSRLVDYPFDMKNREKHLYLILMRGICYKYIGNEEKALEALTFVLGHEDLLDLYIHLAPLACLELGLLYHEKKDFGRAEKYLHKTMNDYSHYLNETLVHIRAHSALTAMKESREGDGKELL